MIGRLFRAALWGAVYFAMLWYVPATRAIPLGFDWWIGVVAFHAIAAVSLSGFAFLVMCLVFSGFDEEEADEE